jgi:hypothetical protein
LFGFQLVPGEVFGRAHGLPIDWVVRVVQSQLAIDGRSPCVDPVAVRPVEIRLKAFAGQQFDVRHHEIQL